MSTIVVTGASGFLGSALLRRLHALGRPALGVSRRAGPGLCQVVDYDDTPAGDVIVHLAEESDRAEVDRLGTAYTDHAAEIVRRIAGRAGHLVYASSGVVYGDSGGAAFRTDMQVQPGDAYARSKVCNEAIALRENATVLRLSNLYGAGMSDRTVLADIARQVPGEGPLRVRDDSPVRDFLCAADAARAMAAAAEKCLGGILNIGSGVGLSIREVAQIALHSVGQSARPIVSAGRSARRSVNVLDIAEARDRLGWAPQSSPRELLGQFFQAGATS